MQRVSQTLLAVVVAVAVGSCAGALAPTAAQQVGPPQGNDNHFLTLDLAGKATVAAPTTAALGHAKVFYDTTKNKLQQSLSTAAWADFGGGGSSGLPTGYVSGLKLVYTDSHTVTVKAGKARDAADAADLTLSVDTALNLDTDGAGGMDDVVLAGAGHMVSGTVTGSSTQFLSAFQPRLISGTAVTSNGGVTLTGTGTHFLTNVRINDLIGNSDPNALVNGLNKVVAIADDTHLTFRNGSLGNSITFAALDVIENPTVQVDTVRTTVEEIDSDTTLLTSATGSTTGFDVVLKAGVKAVTSASTQAGRHYAVWLVGSSLYASTQRTTIFVGGAKRRVGWVTTSDGSDPYGSTTTDWPVPVIGSVIPFAQAGSGNSREVDFEVPQYASGTLLINASAGTATAVWADVAATSAPPTASRAILDGEVDGSASGTFIGLRIRGLVPNTVNSTSFANHFIWSSGTIPSWNTIPLDAAQYFQWSGPTGAGRSFYVALIGYVDEL